MAKFLIYTNEIYNRQHEFILQFYPEAIKNDRDGIIFWRYNNHTIGESKLLGNNIYLLTLVADFLTDIDNVVYSLDFKISNYPHKI